MSELIKQIEELSELQFTVEEIETIIEKKILGVSKLEKAYMKGRLKAQAIVRRQILTMAHNGSTAAAKQFMELVDQSDIIEE